jgi:hypothetical protein
MLFARDVAVNVDGGVDGGCFVAVTGAPWHHPDFFAVKFLKRTADGFELRHNGGAERLARGMTVIGVLVAAIMPAEGSQEALHLRELADQALVKERSRREQVVADAVSRWGQPGSRQSV